MPMTPENSLLKALPIPSVMIDTDERLCCLNAAAEKLLGPGRVGMHYITALRQPDLLDAIEDVAQGAKPRQARYLSHDGARETTWRVHVDRVDSRVLATFEDLTAIEEISQMRRDFVANVSHELRTPLTALMGFIETLGGPARDDAAARDRFLGIMEIEANRMSRLVEDLLSLSRVEEEERVRPMDDVDLSELIEETVRGLAPLADRAELNIKTVLPTDPLVIPGDSRQLRQVLTNLMENAVKYGANGEEIRITLSGPAQERALRGAGVRITVEDFGEGIAPHHLARLTERFYRVDSHRSREVGGTGLGLAIVKHIVNRHRGRLRVESTVGQGSRFIVILPCD